MNGPECKAIILTLKPVQMFWIFVSIKLNLTTVCFLYIALRNNLHQNCNQKQQDLEANDLS